MQAVTEPADGTTEIEVGPDGALYTSNWAISYAPGGGDGSVLRIVP